MNDTDRSCDALHTIPPDLPRDQWVKAGMAFHAAGGDFDTFDQWSAPAANYNAQASRATWRSFKTAPDGVGAGALFGMARDHGWQDGKTTPRTAPARVTRTVEPPPQPAKGNGASEVFARCEAATGTHGYIIAKQGNPDGLRVVPAGDPLRIMGESMAGALAVPVLRHDGTLSTLQLIPTPDVAQRLKAAGKPGKLNLPGCRVEGWFTVGTLGSGGTVYIVEGIGQAWACWQATGAAAVVCFGAGNMGKVATALRQMDDTARLVLCPDRGKEQDAHRIATEIGAAVACLPECDPNNFDANDLMARDGFDVLAALLEGATEPPKPEPRYKLLSSGDLAALPPLKWRIRGVLPAVGLAGLYGPSASGKSFLALDAACAIASGQRWFDCQVEAAPVVYACLEGEAGLKLRAQAWEMHKGRAMPDCLHMVLQSFKLTSPQDVIDLAAVVPAGAVVFIDTLNRAAPLSDENSSKDMGEILEAAKLLQALTGGLVVLIHHTGKDAAKGLRGHSSLFAALDAAVEVSRKGGDVREWKIAKAKDGADGQSHSFRLQVEALGVDSYGDAVTSCTVRVDGSAASVKQVKVPQGGNQKLVYEGVKPLFKGGASGKPGAPPMRPCVELEAAIAEGAKRLTCATDKKTSRAREAMTGLVARGVFGLNEGWLWEA